MSDEKKSDTAAGQDSTDLAKIDGEREAQQAESKPQQKTAPSEGSAPSRTLAQRIPWLASLAIVLVLAVAFMALQNSQQASYLNSVQQKAAELDQQLLQDQQKFQQKLADIQSGIKQYQSQVEKLSGDLSSAQTERFDLEEKIKTVSLQASSKGRDPLKWRIAEVEYLLALANHRLILSQDYGTALTALQDSDQRLRTIADPGLTAIRRVIASEIKSLKSVQPPDIAGMALKLSALVEGISQLPLVNRERLLASETSGLGQEVDNWKEIPAAIWRDVKGLVTVRRNDMAIERILPPDELHYLSQNLGLKIEQARLALLRKDTELFRSNLKDTGLWVGRYFDQDTASVKQVVDTVNELLVVDLKPAMPDISASLRELRLWRESQTSARFNRLLDTQVTKASVPDKTTSRPATPASNEKTTATLAETAEKLEITPSEVVEPVVKLPAETGSAEGLSEEIATTTVDNAADEKAKVDPEPAEQSAKLPDSTATTTQDNIPDEAVEKAAMELSDPATSIEAAILDNTKPELTSPDPNLSDSASLKATLQDANLQDNATMIKPESDQGLSSATANVTDAASGDATSSVATDNKTADETSVNAGATSTNEGVTP